MVKPTNKNKWLISISLFIITVICIVTDFYFTNRLDYVLKFDWSSLSESLSKTQKWLISGTLTAVIVLGVFINLFSSFLYNKLTRNALIKKIRKGLPNEYNFKDGLKNFIHKEGYISEPKYILHKPTLSLESLIEMKQEFETVKENYEFQVIEHQAEIRKIKISIERIKKDLDFVENEIKSIRNRN